MERTASDQQEVPQALHQAVLGLGRTPSWRDLGEGWKRVTDALKGWGFLAVIPIGFAGAGFFALFVLAEGLVTSPWDHASPQDLVWLGMRMPVLGTILAMTLWIALAFAGWIRALAAEIDEVAERYVKANGGTFVGQMRGVLLRWWLFFARLLPYLGVAAVFIKMFGEPIVRAAELEMKSTLRPRRVLVQMAGQAAMEVTDIRGRLGDYYVFVDSNGPKLVARSQILELRGPVPPLE